VAAILSLSSRVSAQAAEPGVSQNSLSVLHGHRPAHFIVHFDWNSAVLTPRAREIIAEAVGVAANHRAARIELTGHAEPTGTRRHNRRLSEHRAARVADEFARLGLPRDVMAVSAFGDSRLLVPSHVQGSGSQNRRVEIRLYWAAPSSRTP
jgi:outer membrane protein OmpA-like peptidoglycan-associated protein